jgi:hypothetical protein
MEEPRIPDRSAEPALQASLDHSPEAKKAANSDEVAQGAPRDSRDDEGNVVPSQGPAQQAEDEHLPDAHEVEEMTGVPESSEDLSDM